LVVTRPPGGEELDTDTIVIRDQVKEVLELMPSVPRLHKLGVLLKGMEYDEGQDEEGMDVDDDIDGDSDRPVSPSIIPTVTSVFDTPPSQNAEN
jgi:sister chromatid cohesion protein DCC1